MTDMFGLGDASAAAEKAAAEAEAEKMREEEEADKARVDAMRRGLGTGGTSSGSSSTLG